MGAALIYGDSDRRTDEEPDIILFEESAFMVIYCFQKQKKAYLGLHVKSPIFLPDFKQIWNLSTNARAIKVIKVRILAHEQGHWNGNPHTNSCSRGCRKCHTGMTPAICVISVDCMGFHR